ncbi:hypothetical protein IFM89_026230 [Coptis chinensis]|uniref:GDSL esterase/lipase n=1 Tax=Coptis chinensis TaxID=261450 RepID=A0A835IEP1_9MAGN|nr:hypothetical protein IFM89_026230 [Coptis chinensis]
MSNSIASFFFYSILPCFLLFTCCSCSFETSGMFVFGSSLVDNGNNNFIQNVTSKADYQPYGIDFPLGPSGRFSNGKNVIDALGELLKLPLIPAFKNPLTKGPLILHGVDYASGGSGILDETGSIAKLYSLGARKFVLISVYPLGCIPFVKTTFAVSQGCLDPLNQAALLFNSRMKSLVDDLKPNLPGSNLVCINTYQIIMDIIKDPATKGFNDTTSGCCEVIPVREGGTGILCKRSGSTCSDRSGHAFFDGLHPTEAVNDLIAKKAYTSDLQSEVYPFNVEQLSKAPSRKFKLQRN